MAQVAERSRNYMFTVNNYTEDNIESLKAALFVKRGTLGREVGPQCGTPHIHVVLWLKYAMTWMQLQKKVAKLGFNPANLEKVKWDKKAKEYSQKGGDVEEWGAPEKAPGKRTDYEACMKLAKKDGCTKEEVQDAFPGLWIRHHKAIQMIMSGAVVKREKVKLAKKMENVELRDWQVEICQQLVTQDDRTVTWVVDYNGRQGKTFLMRYLIDKFQPCLLKGGKKADLTYAYNMEDYVIMDLPRASKDHDHIYDVIEQFKDGMIFTTKWNSHMKIKADGCKVLVYSNWMPQVSKLSLDRWQIYEHRHGSFELLLAREVRLMRDRAEEE